MASWASNLLATGVVLIGALVFGRQVIIWWGVDSTASHPAQEAAQVVGSGHLGDERLPHELLLGDAPLLVRRETLVGDKRAALAALVARGRRALERGRLPDRQPGPAERRMLAGLAVLQPVETLPGRGEIYQQAEGPLLLVAAIGWTSPPKPENAASDGQVAAAKRRVVSWGLGAAAGNDTLPKVPWTLFTWSPRTDDAAIRSPLPQLPTPLHSRRTLSLRADDGAALVGLRGPGNPDEWIEQFDQWGRASGYSRVGTWQRGAASWQATFEAEEQGRIDVQLSQSEPRQMSGILSVAPSPEPTSEQ